ncbi:hypothetical protein ACJZ2D_011245 [Fusarium nematophilum]
MNSLDSLHASHPVDGRSIRVFQVEAIGAQDETRTLPPVIKGRIKVVNLDTRPKFSALSYVWGTSSVPPHQVLCNGCLTNVTTNCWTALLQLINNFGPLTIWIDAICINQRDDKEKERQIPLMRDVYALAQSAYVWLGEGDSDTDEAMEYLSIARFQSCLAPDGAILCHYLGSSKILWNMAWTMTMKNLSCMRARLRHEPLDFFNKNPSLPSLLLYEANLLLEFCEVYLSCIFSMPDARIRSPAMEALFTRQWASRVWTLQEIVLASNPIICCGSKILGWRSVVYSMAYFEHTAHNFTTRLPEESIRVWKRMVLLWCLSTRSLWTPHQS